LFLLPLSYGSKSSIFSAVLSTLSANELPSVQSSAVFNCVFLLGTQKVLPWNVGLFFLLQYLQTFLYFQVEIVLGSNAKQFGVPQGSTFLQDTDKEHSS